MYVLGYYSKRLDVFFYMMDISNVLVVFNSATNFFIYRKPDLGRISFPGRFIGSKKTPVAQTSEILVKDSFSHHEVELLSRTYHDMWCKPEKESGLNLGHRLLIRFLEVKPALANNFGLRMSCEDWPKTPDLQRLGDQFGRFIGSLISGERRGSLVTESRNFGQYNYELGKERQVNYIVHAITMEGEGSGR